MSGRGKPAGRKRKAQTKLPENQETRVFSSFFTNKYKEKDPPPGSHVFLLIQTIFKLKCCIQEIHVFPPIMTIFKLKTHVLTKFHEDWTKNVTSRVFTCFHYIHIQKTAPPPGGHVFSPIWTIFELVRDINKTYVLTKFHDDWEKIVTSRVFIRNTNPPPGGHVFQRTGTIFKLNHHII
ncbi:hypothetical protein DPMN_070485 [Dreissena polymorpha]|uniref:Uncharacterized protein n=1 Tax=Dreissena polymorpha TaxID=45954 RepID=A0A9D4BVP3_DREPO|nr:hypothetical protein DPMN_070485 [Dreissena polymorpha]